MRVFDRYMTVDLLQRFMGVHDLKAMHYQAIAAKTGIETFDMLAQQELKLVRLYKEMGDEMQKQGRNKKRGWILIGMLVVMLMVVGGVNAQEATPPLTPPEGNGEVIVLEPGSGYSTLFVLALVVVTIGGGVLLALQQRNINQLIASVDKTLTNKYVMDEAERRYMESSLSVQQAITFMRAAFQFAGGMNLPGVDGLVDDAAEFLENITDRKPNLTEEDIKAIRRRAVPPPPLDFPPPQFPTGG